jgi:hypothetical protein
LCFHSQALAESSKSCHQAPTHYKSFFPLSIWGPEGLRLSSPLGARGSAISAVIGNGGAAGVRPCPHWWNGPPLPRIWEGVGGGAIHSRTCWGGQTPETYSRIECRSVWGGWVSEIGRLGCMGGDGGRWLIPSWGQGHMRTPGCVGWGRGSHTGVAASRGDLEVS